jgi:RNA polymerase sigma-70 factor (ECF subfamily)
MNPVPRQALSERVTAQTEKADVRRAALGDHDAFERLYRSHVGRVYSLAVRMTGPEQAEDLVQEIFLRAWSKLDTFRGEAHFGTWLYRLGVNHIIRRRSTWKRRESVRASWTGVLDTVAAPRKRASAEALDLERALERLPDRARQVFLLYDVEGWSHQDVARALGVTVGTSKSQLHRARMLMREELNR